ncbi:hypothetical protein OAC70_01460 [Flavobacteriaceae bacterium]|jgi:hypothetical protein|nr:hypothetical protein [Flavobacteriaceae bacterium]MDA9972315.1 hypothetical protein [Flavobacteriaceae bacterium]MDB9886075.1 hypothetical protein [Flavobacteriaceae bacterium]MDC1402508.1 hypothetical protein [Flavobacteriaceae bacterium]
MNTIRARFNTLFATVFAPKVRKGFENIILLLAGIGFLIHLGLIGLKSQGIVLFSAFNQDLLSDPISAIYTPFSLILVYEVYLLLFYLPRSFTSCVSKQFEIISLIVIRKIFKDIPQMDLAGEWMTSNHNLELMVDLFGFLLLFLLIFLFNKNKMRLPERPSEDPNLMRFISSKKIVSVCMFLVLGIMSLSTFGKWMIDTINQQAVGKIDSLFFNQFFTLLILADVVILLISFRYTEQYSKLIRNTGFIIATILIRLSFSADGFLSMILILTGVSFALLILKIYNEMENPTLDSTV